MPQESVTDCACKIQQFGPIVFNNIGYQNSANTIYEAKKTSLLASQTGTLGASGNGQAIFKSDYERMQYLMGRQNRASCGVQPKTFGLGKN